MKLQLRFLKTIISLVLVSCCELSAITSQEVVAMTLLGEAEGEGKYGLRCVANVIYQRTKERKKTPAEICLQPHQFSCWTDNIPQVYKWDKKLKSKQGKEALRLARLVILGIDPLPTDDSNHFYSGNRVPYWAVGKSAKRIGNHVFVEL